MRHRWTVSLLILASVAGACAALAQGRTAEKAPEGLPFKVGDTLSVIYSPGQDRECRVEEIRGFFVRCGNEPRGETWLNVAQATGITMRR